MPDFTQFFVEALREEGIEAEVSHHTDHELQSDIFYIRKNIGGEPQTFHHTMCVAADDQWRKSIAMAAEEVSRMIKSEMEEMFEWDNRSVKVMPYEEPWARCLLCGTEVSLPDSVRPMMWTKEAELSTPKPSPVETEHRTDLLDDGEREALKLYLLGRLRERCEPYCHNFKHNDGNVNYCHN